MDHAEARELIELAAVEPGGLERLAAGDTPEAAALAGHLAGCEACATELEQTARAATRAHAVIAELPDPALRERTLALVRDVGRPRAALATGGDATAAAATAPGPRSAASSIAASAPADVVQPPGAVTVATARTTGMPRRTWRVVGVAAAVIFAALVGLAAGGALRPAGTSTDSEPVAMAAMQAAIRIAGQPDAARVALAATDGSAATGSVIFSPTSGELAMATTGLVAAPAGSTYACWIESGGTRRGIGVLYADGASGTWAGPVDGLAELAPGAVFGVSLVPAGGGTGTPVLRGGS